MHSCTPWNQATQLACDCAKLFSQSMHLKYIRQVKKPFKCKYNEFVHFIRLLYLAPCDLFNIPEAFVFSPNIFFLNCLYNSFLFREYIEYIPKINVYTPPSCQASNSSKTWSSHVRDPIKIRLSNPLQVCIANLIKRKSDHAAMYPAWQISVGPGFLTYM